FMEDEVRWTREDGVYQQTITLDGEPPLADVFRVGMAMLYCQVGETTGGQAVQKDGTWTYDRLTTPEPHNAVPLLHHTFTELTRAGYCEVPNALPAMVDGGAK